MELAGRRVLVTGGQGFIGRAVVARLIEAGAEVTAPGKEEADLADPEQARTSARGVDLLVHLAARAGGVQFQHATHADVLADNHALTASVLRAAADARVRRVFLASSGVVYPEHAATPIGEDTPLVGPADRPTGYAWSKVTDEVLGGWCAERGGLDVVVGRFTNVYGPGGSFDPAGSTVVHALVRRAVEAAAAGGDLEVWGDGTAIRSFLHVDDGAAAVTAVLRHGASGTAYNLDAGQPVAIADLAGLVRDAVDRGLALRFDPSRPTGPPRRVLDPSRLRALGWTPRTTLTDGIAGTVAAYRSHGRTQRS